MLGVSWRELERGVRAAARGFSAPVGGAGDSSDGVLTTICDGLGATQLTVVANGRARVELDGGGSSCAIIAMDRSRGLTSVPISTADFLAHLRPPLLIGLNRMINVESVALGVPGITLFGPTDVAWTRTHYEREICLHHAVPCGPCSRRVCPLSHHDCMRLLSVERVFATVSSQLGESHKTEAA